VPATSSERRGPRTVGVVVVAETATSRRRDDYGRNDVEVSHQVTDDRVRTRTVTDLPTKLVDENDSHNDDLLLLYMAATNSDE